MTGTGAIEETAIQECEGRTEQTPVVDEAEAGFVTGPAAENTPTKSTPWLVAIFVHVTDNVACVIV